MPLHFSPDDMLEERDNNHTKITWYLQQPMVKRMQISRKWTAT